MTTPPFEQSVFINCPFDEEFAPILQAIAFCVTYLGFIPRLAPENADNAAARLDRILELVGGSKYGIHDLSRCKATDPGEYARMNMPFELGLDYACRKFGNSLMTSKQVLVLEHTSFDYQRSLSDIAGWDIRAHSGSFDTALGHVRSWLKTQAGAPSIGKNRIVSAYATFQEWYWEMELKAGSSEDDILTYPTAEFVAAMREWMETGRKV